VGRPCGGGAARTRILPPILPSSPSPLDFSFPPRTHPPGPAAGGGAGCQLYLRDPADSSSVGDEPLRQRQKFKIPRSIASG
jgi:hypothetical protein